MDKYLAVDSKGNSVGMCSKRTIENSNYTICENPIEDIGDKKYLEGEFVEVDVININDPRYIPFFSISVEDEEHIYVKKLVPDEKYNVMEYDYDVNKKEWFIPFSIHRDRVLRKLHIDESNAIKFLRDDMYSTGEKQTFPLQYEEALAFKKDKDAFVPLLESLCVERRQDETVEQLSDKVLNKERIFRTALAVLVTKYRRLYKEILETSSREELDVINTND